MTDRELVARAAEFRSRAYAPYSGFAVGAALLGRSGRIYGGVNVENAAYPVGICAERAAIAAAVTSGERAFEALAVIADSPDGPASAPGIPHTPPDACQHGRRSARTGAGGTASAGIRRGGAAP